MIFLMDNLEPKLTCKQELSDLSLRMGIVKEGKGRPRYPESMSGNGKEGEKDGRGRGKQQGGDNSKFTCPTILQRPS